MRLSNRFQRPNNETLLLLTLAAIKFVHIMDFMVIMPLGPMLMDKLKINSQQFGFLVSSYALSAFLTSFWGIFRLDFYDRKKVLLVAFIGFLIGTTSCALGSTYHLLLVARFVTGAFGGILASTVLSIVGDTIPTERRGYGLSIVMSSFSVAAVFGVPFGLIAADKFGWQAPFFAVILMSMPVFWLLIKFIPSLKSHIKTIRVTPKITDIVESGNQVRALSLCLLLVLSQFCIIPYISPFLVTNIAFPQSNLAYIYLFGGTATFVTAPIIGRVSDKLGKPKTLQYAILASLVPIFLLTNLFPIDWRLVFVITTLFFIFISGRMIPATAIAVSTVPASKRGSFMSLQNALIQLATFLATSISAKILYNDQQGFLINYNLIGAISICIGLIVFMLSKNVKVTN